jgi:hypothetical protein
MQRIVDGRFAYCRTSNIYICNRLPVIGGKPQDWQRFNPTRRSEVVPSSYAVWAPYKPQTPHKAVKWEEGIILIRIRKEVATLENQE